MKALAVYEEANLTHEKCYLFGTIADILCELKNYEKAIEYYNYQIALATRHEYKSLHVRGLVHLGMSYMTHDVFEKAVVVFEQCLRTFCVGPQTDSDFQSIAKTCLINLGISYHQLGVFDQAIDAFDTCLKTVGTTTVEVLEAATVKVHMSCTLLMKQRYSDAIVTGSNH